MFHCFEPEYNFSIKVLIRMGTGTKRTNLLLFFAAEYLVYSKSKKCQKDMQIPLWILQA